MEIINTLTYGPTHKDMKMSSAGTPSILQKSVIRLISWKPRLRYRLVAGLLQLSTCRSSQSTHGIDFA